MQIAQGYPFVKVIQEKKQHQAFAQKTGFNLAKGDILGRIDADTILPKNWVKEVKRAFLNRPSIQAITGGPDPYDVSMKSLAVSVFMFYHKLASRIAGTQMIWGANAAIRRSIWIKIRHQVLQRADIWEDYDLSLLLGRLPAGRQGKRSVRFVNGIDTGSSFRTIHKPFLKQVEWQFRVVRTFYYQTSIFKTVILFGCWSTMIVFYPLAYLDGRIFRPLSAIKERRREILESPAVVD